MLPLRCLESVVIVENLVEHEMEAGIVSGDKTQGLGFRALEFLGLGLKARGSEFIRVRGIGFRLRIRDVGK